MKLLKLLFVIFIPVTSYCQTIKSIFRQLPIECTPDLNNKEKEILLQKHSYTIPGGDSIETVNYTIDDMSKDYMQYEYSFTTGQNGFNIYELKVFKSLNGSDIIIFSTYGGTRASFFQNDLKIFYLKNGHLVEDKKQRLLPQSISIDHFLKKKTPDSIKKIIEQAMSTSYFLTSERKKSIEFTIYPEYPLKEYEKWILGYSFIFTWTGNKFIRKINLEK
jgi:hypothetical protein